MGCRHYFVADRLEDLVDEGDSRSYEFTNTRNFCLFHNCMWQSRHPEVDVYFLTLFEQIDRLFTSNGSPRSNSICIYVFVCVFLFIWTFKQIGTLAAKWETFVDFLNIRTGRWICRNRSPCSKVFLQSREKRVLISWEPDVFPEQTTGLSVLSWFGFGFGWVGWEPFACRATSGPNSFIQSCLTEINLRGLSRWFIHFFVYDFSSFPS